MTLPPIVVILQTWQRTAYALRTIAAAAEHMRYDAPLVWYVADDGSDTAHIEQVYTAVRATHWSVLGMHSERRGYGGNSNAAWNRADYISPLTFWLEDDWELRAPLDLTPYAKLLIERAEIGMVRLGLLNVDVRGRTWAHDGRLYWTLDREPHHEGTPVFTGHPSLRHVRYRQAHGYYPEGLLPGDTELMYALNYRRSAPNTPGILWPADLPAGGVFGHIGETKCETMM